MLPLISWVAAGAALLALLAWFFVTQLIERAARRWYLWAEHWIVDEDHGRLRWEPLNPIKPWYVRWADNRAALASARRARGRW